MRITRSEAKWNAGAFSSETLEKARYLDGQEHDAASQMSERTLMITVDIDPPFERRELITNPLLVSVLKAAFEDDFILGAYGVVWSLQAAPRQDIHWDGANPFQQTPLNCLLLIVAVTVGIPLVEMNDINGTTALWPRSHRDEALASTEIADEPFVWEGSRVPLGLLAAARRHPKPQRRAASTPLHDVLPAWFVDHKNYQASTRAGLRSAFWRTFRKTYAACWREHRNVDLKSALQRRRKGARPRLRASSRRNASVKPEAARSHPTPLLCPTPSPVFTNERHRASMSTPAIG